MYTNDISDISETVESKNTRGMIFDIQRFSIHDGPGIRTTVFFKGCPLKCKWCHNPESTSSQPQLAYYKNKCVGCMACYRTCEQNAVLQADNRINRSLCVTCGTCSEVCPTSALTIIGKEYSVEEVADIVYRDIPFYETSGGGVTLSGGEPLYQFDFSVSLLISCMDAGIHTAVETSGYCVQSKLLSIAEYTNLFLYDIKAIDPQKHKQFCGVDNAIILDNARCLADKGTDIIFRTPIIQSINDSQEDMDRLSEFILSLPGDQKLELMPYHEIGCGKYEALGLEYSLDSIKTRQDISCYVEALRNAGVNVVNE